MRRITDLGELYICPATRETIRDTVALVRLSRSWPGQARRTLAERIGASERASVMFFRGLPLGATWFEDSGGKAELLNCTTALVDSHKIGYVRLFKAGAPAFIASLPERYRRVTLRVERGDTAALGLYLHSIPNARVVRSNANHAVVEADIAGRSA